MMINVTTDSNGMLKQLNWYIHNIILDVLRQLKEVLHYIFSATTEWNIKRGCEVYSEMDDDFQLNDGDEVIGGIATLACASDLCNSVDGNLLSVQPQELRFLSSAPGIY